MFCEWTNPLAFFNFVLQNMPNCVDIVSKIVSKDKIRTMFQGRKCKKDKDGILW